MSWNYPVRGLQAALSMVVLGLMAYVCQWWTSHWIQAPPGAFSFLIFTPAWSLLALIVLLVVQLKFSHLLFSPLPQYGLLALEGATMLYWFAGFVSLAIFLADRICFGQVCDIARASTVLGGVSFAAWAASFGMGLWALMKGSPKKEMEPVKEVEMSHPAYAGQSA